jgi:hypothetical protein
VEYWLDEQVEGVCSTKFRGSSVELEFLVDHVDREYAMDPGQGLLYNDTTSSVCGARIFSDMRAIAGAGCAMVDYEGSGRGSIAEMRIREGVPDMLRARYGALREVRIHDCESTMWNVLGDSSWQAWAKLCGDCGGKVAPCTEHVQCRRSGRRARESSGGV